MSLTSSVLLNCLHCVRLAPHEQLFEHEVSFRYVDAEGYAMSEPANYTAFACGLCTELTLYIKSNLHSPTSRFGEAIYPKAYEGFGCLPTAVHNAYLEATSVRRISKPAFMLLGRRALEVIAQDQGVWTGNLFSSIAALVSTGKLPPVLAEGSELIRLFGNEAAHPGSTEFNQHHVDVVDQFLGLLINYLYVIPDQIAVYKLLLNIEQSDD